MQDDRCLQSCNGCAAEATLVRVSYSIWKEDMCAPSFVHGYGCMAEGLLVISLVLRESREGRQEESFSAEGGSTVTDA